ncbi:MAG: Na+/H+ antiporter subunit E [Marinobacter sp.]|nr:Na+/H+ antiporter subunit E [Marinobacter sp.]
MPSAPALSLITVVVRGALLLALWWVLTLGDLPGLGFGLVVALVVSALSVRLFPPSAHHIRPLGLLRFIGYFLVRSVIAGMDVAGRLLKPGLPIKPGTMTLCLRLPEGSPRWLLANTLSLMPGTLSVLLEGNRLTLHCLDRTAPVEQDVRKAEKQIARVFGLNPDLLAEETL